MEQVNHVGTKQLLGTQMTKEEYNVYRGWEIPKDEDPLEEGYLVEYLDSPKSNHPNHENYISWSPKDVFERAYRPIDSMTFGIALEKLKQGKKVRRKGWNAKGMYLWLLPATTIQKSWVKDPMLLSIFGDSEELDCLGSIRMKTATGEVLTGWLASQTDMLAEDWELAE